MTLSKNPVHPARNCSSRNRDYLPGRFQVLYEQSSTGFDFHRESIQRILPNSLHSHHTSSCKRYFLSGYDLSDLAQVQPFFFFDLQGIEILSNLGFELRNVKIPFLHFIFIRKCFPDRRCRCLKCSFDNDGCRFNLAVFCILFVKNGLFSFAIFFFLLFNVFR